MKISQKGIADMHATHLLLNEITSKDFKRNMLLIIGYDLWIFPLYCIISCLDSHVSWKSVIKMIILNELFKLPFKQCQVIEIRIDAQVKYYFASRNM